MKYLVSIALILLLIDAKAQTGKGSWMTGGSMGITRNKVDGDQVNLISTDLSDQVTVSLSPTVGFFPVKNFLMGVQTSFSHAQIQNSDYKANSSGAGPLVRYYIPFGKFAVFPEAAAVFSKTHLETTFMTFDPDGNPEPVKVTQDTKITQYRTGIGFVWFAATNIGIEGIFGYKKLKYDTDTSFGDSSNKASQLYFNVGLQFYLSRKSEGN